MRPKVDTAADHIRQLNTQYATDDYYIIIIIYYYYHYIIMCNAEATATAVTTIWAGGHADDRPLEGRLRRRRCVDLVRAIYLGENKREKKIKYKNKMKTASDFYNNYYRRPWHFITSKLYANTPHTNTLMRERITYRLFVFNTRIINNNNNNNSV